MADLRPRPPYPPRPRNSGSGDKDCRGGENRSCQVRLLFRKRRIKKSRSCKVIQSGGFRNGPLPAAPSSRPERTALGAGSRRRPRAGLCCHPKRRAPWRTFEFANRPGVRGLLWGSLLSLLPRQSLDKEPRNLESLSGLPAYRVFTLRGERATPAQARRSGPRRIDPGGLASLGFFFFF